MSYERTPEIRAKQSASAKARWSNADAATRHARGEAAKKWWASLTEVERSEVIARQSASMKVSTKVAENMARLRCLPRTDAQREAARMVGHSKLGSKLPPQTQEARTARSAGLKRHYANTTSEQRRCRTSAAVEAARLVDKGAAISKSLKKRNASLTDDERHKQTSYARKAMLSKRQTRLERAVKLLLDSLGVEYIEQHPIGWYHVDFYLPNKRLVLECDGEYWHSRVDVAKKDRQRDAYMHRHGYQIVRLWESEIDRLTVNDLEKRLA